MCVLWCVCVCVLGWMKINSATGKEGNVLFNHKLDTFYLRLYDVWHMVNDHPDSEWGNTWLPHGLFFLISSNGSFICTIPQTGQHIPQPLLHQMWSTGWNKKQLNGSTMRNQTDDLSYHERTLLPRSYILLLSYWVSNKGISTRPMMKHNLLNIQKVIKHSVMSCVLHNYLRTNKWMTV